MSEAVEPKTCLACGEKTSPLSGPRGMFPICSTCLQSSIDATQRLTEAPTDSGIVGRVTSGDLLANRYRVGTQLGRGGMGVVFEAEDLVLGEHVALKIVRGQDPTSREESRLRREVQLARRVTHANVCRIFDLIQHRDPETGALLDLISMELLVGVDLGRYCRSRPDRRLPLSEALPIFRQIARGLNAAHRQGIVHRDLKPSNVMLTREEEGVRAAITDFGLAHRIGPEGRLDAALTQAGRLIGTPAYMAPEQVAGDATSPATDIYGFGVMLHETLAGRLPFSAAQSPLLLAVQRLTHEPTSLTKHRPDLDPRIHGLVERCLAREPADRYGSVHEILEVLDLGDDAWDVYGRKGTAAASTVHAAAGLGGDGAERAPRTPAPVPEPADTRPASASAPAVPEASTTVLPSPSPLSPTHLPVSSGLGSSALASSGDPETPSDGVAPVDPVGDRAHPAPIDGPGLPTLPPRNRWTLALGAIATLFITGCVVGILANRSATSTSGPGPAPSTDEVEAALAEASDLARGFHPRSPRTGGGATQPAGTDAAVLAQAARHLRSFDGASAERLLADALERYPKDADLLTARAEALWRLGREEEALTAIEGAFDAVESGDRHRWLLVRGWRHGLRGEWDQARDAFKSLWILDPTDLETGLRIAEANWYSGRVDPMPEVFDALRRLDDERGGDPRIPLWQSRHLSRIGEFEAMRDLATEAKRWARDQDLPRLEVEATITLANAFHLVGDAFGHRSTVEEVEAASAELGDSLYLGHAKRIRAVMLSSLGRMREAQLAAEAAIADYATRGSTQGLCGAHLVLTSLSDLPDERKDGIFAEAAKHCLRAGRRGRLSGITRRHAGVWRNRGELTRAVALYRRGVEYAEAVGDQRELALGRLELSLLFAYLGRIDEMLETLAPLEVWLSQRTDPTIQSYYLMASASGHLARGRLDRTADLLIELESLEPIGESLFQSYLLRCGLAWERGDSQTLRREAAAMAQLARNAVDESFLDRARAFEAQALLLEGRWQASLDALSGLDSAGDRLTQAWLHLRLGDQTSAEAALAQSWDASKASKHQGLLWGAEILRAEIDARGDLRQSVDRLLDLEREARTNGFLGIAIEARVARGRITADGRLLEQARQEATSLDYLRLAGEAKDALSSASGDGRDVDPSAG